MELAHPPIVEAVLDIDCDLAPTFDLATVSTAATAAFASHYPVAKLQYREQIFLEPQLDTVTRVNAGARGINALQYFQKDEQQLVQVRALGYSFNRLAPYVTLDSYLPEIQRTWSIYVKVAAPVAIRRVTLRYINRILLPFNARPIDLDDYFRTGPRLPSDGMASIGFVLQNSAVDVVTGFDVTTVLASQEQDEIHFAVVLDIAVASSELLEVDDPKRLWGRVEALRTLKNSIFERTVTPKCLQLFQ